MPDERVLVIDDERQYLSLIRFNLEAGGYHIACAETGEDGLALLREWAPDLVILDIMLPRMDGFETCRRMRQTSMVPIIMLTAKGAEEDKVRGLRLGADDYVTKPFAIQELVARVEAVLRRSHVSETPARKPAFQVGDLHLDFASKRVDVRGREVVLSPTEYRLLAALAASAGTVLSHEELLEGVWGVGYRGEMEMLRVTLWRLRQKVEDDPANPRYVITRPGLGYMLAT